MNNIPPNRSILPSAQPFASLSFWHKVIYSLGVGLGSGLSPKAPGTAGSAAVLVLMPLWLKLGLVAAIVVMGIAFIAGIYICGKTADLMGVHDDGRIVWDEFVGQSVALLPLLLPQFSHFSSVKILLCTLIGFLLFRIFDVLKPFPISYLDKNVHGGLGIILDDVLAGVVAAGCLWVGLVNSVQC